MGVDPKVCELGRHCRAGQTSKGRKSSAEQKLSNGDEAHDVSFDIFGPIQLQIVLHFKQYDKSHCGKV